jgi:hypothetical protein
MTHRSAWQNLLTGEARGNHALLINDINDINDLLLKAIPQPNN